MSATRRLARTLLWAGVALFWASVAALAVGTDLAIVDAILLSMILAALPFLALAQVPLVSGVEIDRMPAYWSSILTLWLLGTACWLVGTRDGGAAAIGFVVLSPGALVGWSLGLTAACLAVIGIFRRFGAALGVADSEVVRRLLPQSREERTVFGLLSLAAGVGEELAYRGYAISVLSPLIGTFGASALSSVVFGVLHGYQGTLGIFRTMTMGALLAWGFVVSGSVVPGIVAHTLVDVIAGIVLGERLLSPVERGGVAKRAEEGVVEGT